MPVHGEFRMLAAHAQLAQRSGVPAGSIVLAENGSVVELDESGPRIVDRIETGRHVRRRARSGGRAGRGAPRPAPPLGARRPDRRRHDRRERRRSSGEPELIARGFGETEPLVAEMRGEAAQVLDDCLEQDITEIKLLQEHLHDSLAQLVYDRTGRRPMILPVIVEV